jgi:alpha-amylase
MQHEAINNIYLLEKDVLATKDEKLIEDWRKLQTSDHFYYMCTKWFADGDVHKYFNPYDTPYDAFIAYNNVLHDLRIRIDAINKKSESPKASKKQTTKKATTTKSKTPRKVAKKK